LRFTAIFPRDGIFPDADASQIFRSVFKQPTSLRGAIQRALLRICGRSLLGHQSEVNSLSLVDEHGTSWSPSPASSQRRRTRFVTRFAGMQGIEIRYAIDAEHRYVLGGRGVTLPSQTL